MSAMSPEGDQPRPCAADCPWPHRDLRGHGRAVPTVRDLKRVIDTVGIVQIDSVNVLARSQYLPFSRLGPYDTGLLDALRDRAPRHVGEYWLTKPARAVAGLAAPASGWTAPSRMPGAGCKRGPRAPGRRGSGPWPRWPPAAPHRASLEA